MLFSFCSSSKSNYTARKPRQIVRSVANIRVERICTPADNENVVSGPGVDVEGGGGGGTLIGDSVDNSGGGVKGVGAAEIDDGGGEEIVGVRETGEKVGMGPGTGIVVGGKEPTGAEVAGVPVISLSSTSNDTASESLNPLSPPPNRTIRWPTCSR
mmetsp:Transcript_23663/g.40137  ORF Transcript_23663/g.40137 Transcript_23663/m.40137 type:complete len:156 (-) Transcript_23663:449-916(-)